MDEAALLRAIRLRRLWSAGLSGAAVLGWMACWALGGGFGWLLLVACPALFGVEMLWVPPGLRATRAYWLLAAAWLAAAGFGALSHWDALSPVTVWLSLARYVLIALALGVILASRTFLCPVWLRPAGSLPTRADVVAALAVKVGPRPRWWQRVGWGAALAGWAVAVAVAVFLTPWRMSTIPEPRGLQWRTVFTAEEGEEIRAVAFSPRRDELLVQVLNRVWLVPLPDGRAARMVTRGELPEQNPWLPSGEEFVVVRPSGPDSGIWIIARDGRRERQLFRGRVTGDVACAPDGRRVALRKPNVGLVVMAMEGAATQLVAADGYLPRWSPSGKQLLFQGWRKSSKRLAGSYFVVRPGQRPRELPIPWSLLAPVAWVTEDHIAVVSGTKFLETDSWKAPVSVDIYSVTGARVRLHLGELALWGADLLASPKGDCLIASLHTGPPIPWGSRMVMVDLEQGCLRRLRASPFARGAAWSPDGHAVAIIEPQPGLNPGGRSLGGPRVKLVRGL